MTKSKTYGFTLIESLIALAVVSIALVALLGLHLNGIKMAQTADNIARAVSLAQTKLAEKTTLGCPQTGTESGTTTIDRLPFHWKTIVSRVTNEQLQTAGIHKLRQVSTEVEWQQGNTRKRICLSTWVAKRNWQ